MTAWRRDNLVFAVWALVTLPLWVWLIPLAVLSWALGRIRWGT